LYTLADLNNKELGWGQAGESWRFLAALERLGGESWFKLGDQDLATHIVRTNMLQTGARLSEVVSHLCEKMGIKHRLAPMSDDEVSTVVHTRTKGDLAFQHYFVRDRCEPAVTGFSFAGIDKAKPSAGFSDAITPALKAVIVCPSNPFVSVDPILALPGITDKLQQAGVPLIVVSNIVGGEALKGPAAKMMRELAIPQTALGVAEHYAKRYAKNHGDLIKGFVLDNKDKGLAPKIEALGLATIVTNTVMVTLPDRIELARRVLEFAANLRQGP
ncbi:MAG: 2-phospho-L-lactate transferase CofD family protein, partial [Pseudomonadales bacterium]